MKTKMKPKICLLSGYSRYNKIEKMTGIKTERRELTVAKAAPAVLTDLVNTKNARTKIAAKNTPKKNVSRENVFIGSIISIRKLIIAAIK